MQSIARTCLSGCNIEVLFTRLDPEPEVAAGLLSLLDHEERIRADRYAFERDRSRFVVARARLRQLLAVRLGVSPETIEFVRGAQGKPALAAPYAKSKLRFNVSHSANIALYAFAYGREVGVDVEAVRVMPDANDIAERFFSVCENNSYRDLDSRNKPYGFFNCWTRKEAFVKALGDGLSHPLDSFDVSLVPGEPAGILRHGDISGHDCGWRLSNIVSLPTGYVGAVAFEDSSLHGAATAFPQSSGSLSGAHK